MSYTLRPAGKEDVHALSALAGETFRDGWASVIGTEMADAYVAEYLTVDHFCAEVVNPTNYVVLAIDETDTPIGYAELKTARPVPEAITTPNPALLQRLYVAGASRGTGIADVLLADVEAEALRRGFLSLYLETDPRNERAWRFYEKRGFTESGCTIYYLPNGANDNVRFLVRAISPNDKMRQDDPPTEEDLAAIGRSIEDERAGRIHDGEEVMTELRERFKWVRKTKGRE